MYGKLKLAHHSHSLRLRPHEHTSYLPLAILVLVVGIALSAFTISDVLASPGPEAGSIGLTGKVPAEPPKTAATITSPNNQQRFSTTPIQVSGTCPDAVLVEIFKNEIFAGSTFCSNGKYSVNVDLLYGKNILTAKVYDALNQVGPDSNSVTVYYDTLPFQGAPSSLLNFTGDQLLLRTDAVYRGTFPQQTLNVPISIIGGTAPFAVNVDWGDSSNKLIPRSSNTVFNATHVYKKPGVYTISLQGSDSKQLVAFLAVAAIINGQPSVIGTSTTKPSPSKLLALWPLFAIVATMVVSFWMGERREKRILEALQRTQNQPFGPMPQPHT